MPKVSGATVTDGALSGSTGRGLIFLTVKFSGRLIRVVAKRILPQMVSYAIVRGARCPIGDKDRTRLTCWRALQCPVWAHVSESLEEGSIGSGAGPEWRRRFGCEWRPTKLVHHYQVPWEADVEVSSWLVEVRSRGEWGASQLRLETSLRQRIVGICLRASPCRGADDAWTGLVVVKATQVFPGSRLWVHVSLASQRNHPVAEPPSVSTQPVPPGVTQEDAPSPPWTKDSLNVAA